MRFVVDTASNAERANPAWTPPEGGVNDHGRRRVLHVDYADAGLPRMVRRGALTKFTISASFAEKAYAFWEPIFKRAGPHVKMLTRISDPEM